MPIKRPDPDTLDEVLVNVPQSRRQEVAKHAEVTSSGRILSPLPHEVWALGRGEAVRDAVIGEIVERTTFRGGRAVGWEI